MTTDGWSARRRGRQRRALARSRRDAGCVCRRATPARSRGPSDRTVERPVAGQRGEDLVAVLAHHAGAGIHIAVATQVLGWMRTGPSPARGVVGPREWRRCCRRRTAHQPRERPRRGPRIGDLEQGLVGDSQPDQVRAPARASSTLLLRCPVSSTVRTWSLPRFSRSLSVARVPLQAECGATTTPPMAPTRRCGDRGPSRCRDEGRPPSGASSASSDADQVGLPLRA